MRGTLHITPATTGPGIDALKKPILISLGFLFFVAGLIALVAGGCTYTELDLPPCAETIPCPEPPANPCPNVASDRWTSLGLENESVTAIAVHPCNPGIIYAGTQFDFSAGIQGKLFKSTDCGQSWDTLAIGGSYRTIQLSPGNPDVVYAVNGGILKSTNAGKSWQRADEGISLDAETSAASLAINPKNACDLYAGTSGFFGGDLYKSTDAGASWRLIEGKGLKENRLANGVISLAIDPADPGQVFAGTAWAGDVLYSANGGNTWKTTRLFDTGSIVDVLKIADDSRRIYAGIRFEGLFFAHIDPYLDQWEQIMLPDSVDNTVVDLTFYRGTVFLAGRGILAEKDGTIKSYSEGIENKIVGVVERGSSSPSFFIGLKRLDNLGPNSGGIYTRRY